MKLTPRLDSRTLGYFETFQRHSYAGPWEASPPQAFPSTFEQKQNKWFKNRATEERWECIQPKGPRIHKGGLRFLSTPSLLEFPIKLLLLGP